MARDLFEHAAIPLPKPKSAVVEPYLRSAIDIVEIIGEDKARVLAEKLGGVHRPGRELKPLFIEAIGEKAGTLLADTFGHEVMYIPKHIDSPALRSQRVIELRGHGVRITDIALTVGLTERQVYSILRAARTRKR